MLDEQLDQDLIFELNTQLERNIVWIRYGERFKYPYTNCSNETIKHTHKPTNETKQGCITAYNLLTKKTEHLELKNINDFDYELGRYRPENRYMRQKMEIESAIKHCPDVDPKMIIECRVDTTLGTYKECVWCALTLLDFRVTDLKTLKDLVIDDDWREWYMNKIRKCREKSFVELDQLEEEAKKDGSSAEDLEDIETIKQMFRDIPQDCDLTSYKTIVELLEFWPSLLLPRPFLGATEANTFVALQKIKEVMLYVDGRSTPEQELLHILQEIDDVSELENILNEISKIADTDIVVPDYAVNLLHDRIKELSK